MITRTVSAVANALVFALAVVFPAGRATAVTTSPCGSKPAVTQCKDWICGGAGWEPSYYPAGTPCNDGNACTYADACNGTGACRGTAISCPSTGCQVRACNGTSSCTVTSSLSPGQACDDGIACTYGDTCNASLQCIGTPITCTSEPCMTRACNGTAVCTETPINPYGACDDGQACTYEDRCTVSGRCSGTPVSCPSGPCIATATCNGTATCTVAYRPAGTLCPASTNPRTARDLCPSRKTMLKGRT